MVTQEKDVFKSIKHPASNGQSKQFNLNYFNFGIGRRS
nr:MAG TPA: hypothetical protein [Caudoviricetes sp.]